MISIPIFNLQYISSVLTYRGVTPYFENLRNRRLRWIMIRSHESFQESYLKVVKPMTKWDILKITPLRIDCMIACLVPVSSLTCYPSPWNLELNPEALRLIQSAVGCNKSNFQYLLLVFTIVSSGTIWWYFQVDILILLEI